MDALLDILYDTTRIMEIRTRACEKQTFPVPNNLSKVLEVLIKKSYDSFKLPDTSSIEILAKRIKDYYNTFKMLVDLDRNDIKLLPYVLYYVEDIGLGKLIIRRLDNITINSILKREIAAYFLAPKLTGILVLLRNSILEKLNVYKGRNSEILTFKEHIYLFYENASVIVLDNISKEGFFEYFVRIGFTNLLLSSWFVKAIMINFFENCTDAFAQYKLFTDTVSNVIYKDVFYSILPLLLGKIILTVENDLLASNLKKLLQNEAINLFGDPRILKNRNSAWQHVGAEATSIFIKWLSRYDLKLFFEIINKGLGLDNNAKRMWSYRRVFWSSYINEISSVWVCYGNNARIMIDNSKIESISFGRFADANKSCIIIEIGDYVFVERSHNGSAKVWHKLSLPQKLYCGVNFLGNAAIVNQNAYRTWNHNGSESYSWQNKIGEFIATNCGVHRSKVDWQI